MEVKKRMKGEEILCGGWCPIEDTDIKDPCYNEFAISEYNKHSNSKLKLETVVSGDLQIVKGINFRLVLDVRDGEEDGASKTYEAEVYEWLSRVLTYFKALH